MIFTTSTCTHRKELTPLQAAEVSVEVNSHVTEGDSENIYHDHSFSQTCLLE